MNFILKSIIYHYKQNIYINFERKVNVEDAKEKHKQ